MESDANSNIKTIEYCGKNCYIQSNGYCFIKCNIFLTGEDYKQKYLEFIRNEDRRSNILTKARIQPCLGKLGVILRRYNGNKCGLELLLNEIKHCFHITNSFV